MGWTKDEVDKYVAKVERNMNSPREVKNLLHFFSAMIFKSFDIERPIIRYFCNFILWFRKILKDSPLLGFTERPETT